MMHDRFGGAAGILAGIILIVAYGLLTIGFPPQTCCSAEFFRQLPQFKTVSVMTSLLIPSAWLVSMPMFLALYADIREARKRFALLGVVAGLAAASIGSITLFEGILGWLRFSDLYQMTPDSLKNTVVAAAEAWGHVGSSVLLPILLLLIVSFIAVGIAMLRARVFRRASGLTSIALGTLLFVSLLISGFLMFLHLWTPGLFALIVLPIIVWLLYMGFQLYRLSTV